MDQNDSVVHQQSDIAVDNISQPTEKMVPQSQVDKIVKTVKLDVAHKAREEALEEYRRSQPQQSYPSASTNSNLTVDEVRKIISEEGHKQYEEAQKAQLMHEAHRIANEFKSKIEAGKSLHSDFEQVVNNLPFASISHVVSIANEFENTADLMYELGKNPTKLATIHQIAQLNPALAKSELTKLSDSIKLNQQAKSSHRPNPPLSQIPSSPISVDGGSSMSVRDFRRLRAQNRS